MKALLDGLKGLGPARLAAMAAVAVGMLGLIAFLAMRSGGNQHMSLLYGDLEMRDSAQMVDQLDRLHIPHALGGDGTTVLVPSDRVAEARMSLAKVGLPSGGSIGYELFDRGDGLTSNQFQQSINQTRAIEGELARSIRMIQGVRLVRVHVVLSKREPFAREQQDAQASIMLTMNGAARLDREAIQAVLNLVAAAVPGLKAQNISIVDSRGDLLASAGQPSGPAGAALTTDSVRHAAEMRLSRAVEEMLEHSLGAGRVRAEAAIEMDFDQLHETQEKYDPDGQVARSTQSVTSNSKSTEKDTSVSVQNNLPNPDQNNNAAGSQEQRQEETTNFEITKTVRTIVHDQPQIKRISLAVMVDGTVAPGPDGIPVWKERPAAELQQISQLVRSAVGYDEKRGDSVSVVSMRFASDVDLAAVKPPGLLGFTLEKADFLHLAELLLFGIVAVLTLLLVLRPMVLRLAVAQGAEELGGDMPSLVGGATMANGMLAGGGEAGAEGGVAGLLEDESMVNLAHVEGQMRASSIRKIADLVEQHPEASLHILRNWMGQEAA
jgi:flagellar M-ring protein FliF